MNKLLVKTSGLARVNHTADDNRVKTLMLLHGWGMNSLVWEPIREALESKFHIIWVDLPGHGFNRNIQADSLQQMIDLIAAVTSKNTHLIGWSLGGIIAQALTNKIPQKIKSMTLVTSTPRFSQDISSTEKWQHAMSEELLTRFADNLKNDTEKTLKSFIALQFIGVKDSKQSQDELINHILYNKKTLKRWGGVTFNDEIQDKSATELENVNIPTPQALDVGLSILKQVDLRNIKSTCPQHWIFAEYDRLIPKEVINDLISLRPDAEITLLKKAGHAPFITHRDSFLKHAVQFIEALD